MVSDYRGQSLVRSLQARIDELENEVRLQKSNAGGAYERIAELQARVDELEGWNAEMVEFFAH
jgi:outer membrane murein-binding lipoprotein Lpp